MHIGIAIKVAREKMGMSQGEVSLLSGIDRSHISKIERGERDISATTLVRLGDAIGIDGWKILRFSLKNVGAYMPQVEVCAVKSERSVPLST